MNNYNRKEEKIITNFPVFIAGDLPGTDRGT